MKSHQADNETQEEQDGAVKQGPPVSWRQHLMGTSNSGNILCGKVKQG